MVKGKMIRATAVAAACAAVLGVTGVVGASSALITNTGPSSLNKVKASSHHSVHVANNNNLGLSNGTSQYASSGNVKVKGNTTGGDATSGDSANHNSTSVMADVTNSTPVDPGSDCGCGVLGGTIDTTGPDSVNVISSKSSSKLKIENNNNISISNSTDQMAGTGDASVSHNTTGGDATSGDASNTNSTTVDLTVHN